MTLKSNKYSKARRKKRNRMLVVDDEPDANITLKTLLEENGFETDAHTDPLGITKF